MSGDLERAGATTLARRETDGSLPPERVQAMFNRIARPYDTMNRVMTAGLDRRWRALAADEAGIGRGASVLDCCCGTGDLALELARRVGESGEVIGVDFADEMLVHARRKAERAGARQVRFVHGDALALPLDDRVAAATVAFGVRNLADVERGFRELARVVRPRGRVVCLEITQPTTRPRWRASTASGSTGSCPPSAASSTAATRRTRTCRPRCAASPAPTSSAAPCSARASSASATACSRGGIVALHVADVPR